jgi:hypothetical protein
MSEASGVPGRRNRRRGSARHRGFELEGFEYTPATDSTALVRVIGRWRGGVGDPSRTLLMASEGGRTEHFAPLTVGDEVVHWTPGEELQGVAFSVPLAMLQRGEATFVFYPSPGQATRVDTPTERLLRRPSVPEPAAPTGTDPSPRGLDDIIAGSASLARRISDLRLAVHRAAGVPERPLEARPRPRRIDADPEALRSLRDDVAQGRARVAVLEARAAELRGELDPEDPSGRAVR